MTTATRYASFLRRLMATVIDMLILMPVTSLILYLWLGQEKFMALMLKENPFDIGPEEFVVNYALPIVLTIFLWLKFAGTPGKLLASCKVVDAETLGPLTLSQAIIRYFAYIISSLPLGLGFLWIIWDKNKQGFHDKLSKTCVIQESDEDLLKNDNSNNNFVA